MPARVRQRTPSRGARSGRRPDLASGRSAGDHFGHKSKRYDIPLIKLFPMPTKPVRRPASFRARQGAFAWPGTITTAALQAIALKPLPPPPRHTREQDQFGIMSPELPEKIRGHNTELISRGAGSIWWLPIKYPRISGA